MLAYFSRITRGGRSYGSDWHQIRALSGAMFDIIEEEIVSFSWH